MPVAYHRGQLYFLFGKENQYERSAPGWSDFGGGADNTEEFTATAAREASEELTGFLGTRADIAAMMRRVGTLAVTLPSDSPKHTDYRMFIVPFEYDDALPFYFNNNRDFLETKLTGKMIQCVRVFEKRQIAWFSFAEMRRRRREFRCYFRAMVDRLVGMRAEIERFVRGRGGRCGQWLRTRMRGRGRGGARGGGRSRRRR